MDRTVSGYRDHPPRVSGRLSRFNYYRSERVGSWVLLDCDIFSG